MIAGATETLQNEVVSNVLIEITFCDLFQQRPEPLQLFGVMKDFGYHLTGVYHQQIRDNRLNWADVLWTRTPV